jgi:hypothetical protein
MTGAEVSGRPDTAGAQAGTQATGTRATGRADATATANAERILAAMGAFLRLGSLLLVGTGLAAATGSGGHGGRVAWVSAAIAVESAAFAVLCLRRGAPRRRWVAPDQVAVAVAVFFSTWPVAAGAPVESPLFNFALVSVVVAGLAPWPWWATVATAAASTVAIVIPALLAHDPLTPTWTVLPDAMALPTAAMIAWLVARLIRRSAGSYDEQRTLTVRRAEELARERERMRQGAALRARLLGTLETVVAADAVAAPALANQLRQEVQWLHRIVDVGLADPQVDLRLRLGELAAEKTATGLRVDLELPDDLPDLPVEARQALLDATREALTNVAKHSGSTRATVRVSVSGGDTVVDIADGGRGYDSATSPPGTGQTNSILRRLADASGSAEIHTTPGSGTRVVLRIPGGAR